jgi:hypothetical protein
MRQEAGFRSAIADEAAVFLVKICYHPNWIDANPGCEMPSLDLSLQQQILRGR